MRSASRTILTAALLTIGLAFGARAQFSVEGDFRVRWYSDSFQEAMDSRGRENFIRYLGRIRARARVSETTIFSTEIITLTDNPASPLRNIAGTGTMRYGISQLFAEMTEPDFLVFDVARLRVGRQQFPIGTGLSMGESYYFIDKFDGVRVDAAYDMFTLSMFGAITGQNLSSTGLYPDPGSDQIYVARLGADVLQQDVMSYVIAHRPRGVFNDSYIMGLGSSGSVVERYLEYNIEGAFQTFNVAPGLPKKQGFGYMGGIGYRWTMGPFRAIKVETRYASYQGDDASTSATEQFSPPYPSFFWGSRTGWVNGEIGGDYPWRSRNVEGSRLWYTRLYVIPQLVPRLRVQLQYIKAVEDANNDGYNTLDDEVSLRFYYSVAAQSQLQLRLSYMMPNGEDRDADQSGTLSSIEDRMYVTSLMMEWQIRF